MDDSINNEQAIRYDSMNPTDLHKDSDSMETEEQTKDDECSLRASVTNKTELSNPFNDGATNTEPTSIGEMVNEVESPRSEEQDSKPSV
jgi:hypothetical protein